MHELVFVLSGFLLFLLVAFTVERLFREIFFFEGIRMGGRMHQWLYDRWASTYDKYKVKIQKNDDRNLISPLLERLSGNNEIGNEILVLDVGTGTGRFPEALLKNPQFKGRVVGIDISKGMIRQAAKKLRKYGNRAALLNQPAISMPFPDETIDVVSCLETIELLPDRRAHLRELYRILRPGGILMISRNTGEWGIHGVNAPPEVFSEQLSSVGFEQVEITDWWKWFDLVWAKKNDES